jgi:predicted transcriptional regulator
VNWSTQLRAAREALGVSQYELARRLGVSQSAVAQTEGSADMRESTVRRYCEALGLDAMLALELGSAAP